MDHTNADSREAPIVRVEEDANAALARLFAAAQIQRNNVGSSYNNRGLPESFFSPNHSRQNSETSLVSDAAPDFPRHGRTHSSPAMLQNNGLELVPQHRQLPVPQHQQPAHPQHTRALSHCVFNGASDGLGPMPHGWGFDFDEQGRQYFMNHLTRTTQWEDPRRQLHMQMQMAQLQQQLQNHQLHEQPQPPQQQPSSTGGPDPTMDSAMPPLPPGWEEGRTPQGEPYYINHNTKETTWCDPRITAANAFQQASQAEQLGPNSAVQMRPFALPQNTQVRLQRLVLERHTLIQNQLELKKMQAEVKQTQEMPMRHNLGESAVAAPVNSPQQQQFLLGMAVSMIDVDGKHDRQLSADSGVSCSSQSRETMAEESPQTPTDMDATMTEDLGMAAAPCELSNVLGGEDWL